MVDHHSFVNLAYFGNIAFNRREGVGVYFEFIWRLIMRRLFRKKIFLEAIVLLSYQLSRIALGLFVHPYLTMRTVARSWLFLPMSFLPGIVLVWMWITARLIAQIIDTHGVFRLVVGTTLMVFSITLVLWQIMLAYLLVRFGFKTRHG